MENGGEQNAPIAIPIALPPMPVNGDAIIMAASTE